VDFPARNRFLDPGPCELTGRAWSGGGHVTRVEVSVDGGVTWHDAELGAQPDQYAWAPWRWIWEADTRGSFELCCRATDAAGNVQPIGQRWNRQGMANNHVQRVSVLVR
jgi:hypothetical protein